MDNRCVIADQQATLFTTDGVRISAAHVLGDGETKSLAFVVVHGLTGGWREERVQKILARLAIFGGVVALDMRGHGRSGGSSTLGMGEVLDVSAVIAWARNLGYENVVTVGFSMGGSVAIRQAALHREKGERVDAVVSVSGTAFWYYRGTPVMRLVHRLIETHAGRVIMRTRGVRVGSKPWPTPAPISPVEAAALLGATPLLVVHGTVDHYFPVEHARAIYRAAIKGGSTQSEEWIIEGFGHGESAIDIQTIDDIGQWAVKRCQGEDNRPKVDEP